MKTAREILLLFLLSTTLCSCPYSSSHTIDESSNIYVEEALLGNWITYIKTPSSYNKEEAVYVNLSKKTDTEYNIAFTGYLDDIRRYRGFLSDSLTGSAFMSTIGDRQFFNITLQSRVYITELQYKNGKLSLLPLVEHFTNKMIFNSADLRNSIDFHYKSRVHPLIDKDFCLRDMIKIE